MGFLPLPTPSIGQGGLTSQAAIHPSFLGQGRKHCVVQLCLRASLSASSPA